MRIQRVLAPLLLAVMIVCVSALSGAADPSATPGAMAPAAMPAATPHIPGVQLVQVKACNPKLNVQQSCGMVGYAPGYYGRGGYWGNVYGATIYQPPVTTTDPQLGIDYVNISHKPMTSIEFGLIANGRLVAEVKDVGTFSPGAEIKHKFGISPNVFPLQTGLPQCVPLKITYADGTKWRSNKLPPANPHINPHP